MTASMTISIIWTRLALLLGLAGTSGPSPRTPSKPRTSPPIPIKRASPSLKPSTPTGLQASWSNNDLPSSARITVTRCGYIDDVTALHWLNNFNRASISKTKGPFTLPPHTTHLLQPLDVKVFSPLKYWHKEGSTLLHAPGVSTSVPGSPDPGAQTGLQARDYQGRVQACRTSTMMSKDCSRPTSSCPA